jgi:hypothetical protein
MSAAYTIQPLGAAGNVIVPFAAVVEPIVTLKAKVLFARIVGPVPKPDEIVGNVEEINKLLLIDKLVFTLMGDERNAPPGPTKPTQLPLASYCAWTGTRLFVEVEATLAMIYL